MGSLPQSSTTETCDYVVCGGGTAGCVLAARLAEDPSVSVLLVEAGKLNADVPASSIPGGAGIIVGSDDEWNIKSKPTSSINDRSVNLVRGKFLGGSSGCNGALAIRGSREDYDQWDLPGWSGNEVFEYMKKAECFHPTPWFTPNKAAHGSTGPLHIAPHEPCPLTNLVLQAYQETGLPLVPDVFSTGESPHACGHALRTIYQGVRRTSADFVAGNNKKENIRVKANVFVDSVILEELHNGRQKATGVLLQGPHGESIEVKASKEVILCGGSFGSPAILLRSGIGPKDELKDIGVECKIDLKGVGKNLMDHPLAIIFYEVAKPGLTTDHLIWHDGAQARSMAEYSAHKTGFFSQFPFGVFAFARLDDRLSDSPLYHPASHSPNNRDSMDLLPSQPHVEMWNTECYGPFPYTDTPSDDKCAFAMLVTLFAAQSRGTVTISTRDPAANPVVDHRHMEDPRDMAVLAEGCRLANEVVTGSEVMKEVVVGGWPEGAVHHEWKERRDWEGFLRDHAGTCYHPAGTCKMGKEGDDTAVLNANLKVRGVDGLRIVDASVMPLLMGGHPQMAVYAIAEKAADMIKMGA